MSAVPGERCVSGAVRGRVQGVSFRASLRAVALRAGVRGWVANATDGSVRFVLQGPEADVASVLSWASHGPPHARVDALSTAPCDARCPPATSFVILDRAPA